MDKTFTIEERNKLIGRKTNICDICKKKTRHLSDYYCLLCQKCKDKFGMSLSQFDLILIGVCAEQQKKIPEKLQKKLEEI